MRDGTAVAGLGFLPSQPCDRTEDLDPCVTCPLPRSMRRVAGVRSNGADRKSASPSRGTRVQIPHSPPFKSLLISTFVSYVKLTDIVVQCNRSHQIPPQPTDAPLIPASIVVHSTTCLWILAKCSSTYPW